MKVYTNFYKLMFMLALVSMSLYVSAVPACPDTLCIAQPDGTNINVCLRGDEWFHWNTTVDNVPIVKNTNGIYEYGIINDSMFVSTGIKAHDFNERSNAEIEYISNIVNSKSQHSLLSSCIRNSKQKSNQKGAKSLQTPNTIGTLNYVTILMQFPDMPFLHGQANFDSLLNMPNYNNYGNHGSVRDYYYDNSCGQLTVNSTVVGPYTAQHNLAYYSTGNDIGSSRVRELIQEAVNASKNDANYAICDNNNDGYVDLVHVVFAGHGAEITDAYQTIWSHRWVLQNDITDDGKIIHDYLITPELNSYPGTEMSAIGTICHEFGHILGAPDFYDSDDSNGIYIAMGFWDVMDVGSHNDSRHCPAMHNPYSVSQIFHWRDVQNIIKQITPYTLLPIENSTSQKYYRLNTSTSGEYFLLENRKKTGWDSSVLYYSDGLLIYHIHKDIATTSSQDLNDLHPLECYIVSSSATSEPNSTPSSYGSLFTAAYPGLLGNKMFFDSLTTPKAQSWAGDAVNIGLNFIRKEGNNIVFNTKTYIDGLGKLCGSNQYSIFGIPSSATISWSYETNIQQVDTFPILILSNTNAQTTIAQIGSYYTNNNGLPTNEHLYSGIVTLKATVTYNNIQRTYSKNIILHEDTSPTIPASQRRKIGLDETRTFCIDNCTDVPWNKLKWVITLPSATSSTTYYGRCWSITTGMLVVHPGTMNIKLYNLENCDPTLYTDYNIKISYLIPVPDPSLSFANPVTTGTVDISVTDRNYAKGEEADSEAEKRVDIDYTLELWSENSRTVRTIRSTLSGEKDVVTLDVSNLPNGIYFLTMKVDNEILTTEKMIINH